jgi:hypothetical protein
LVTTSVATAKEAAMTKKTTRVQLELPQSSYERLKQLQERTEATSYAEVIRNALRLYEGLLKEADAGNDVVVRQANGGEIVYKAIFS